MPNTLDQNTSKEQAMTTPGLTKSLIEDTVATLPPQYQAMIRLLLIQYLDVQPSDIEYMMKDGPDPRMQLGIQVTAQNVSKHALQRVSDRADQYRDQVRQKRERMWLQMECSKKQISRSEIICKVSEDLLSKKFGYDKASIQEMKAQARSAIPKPAIRALDRQWDKEEITQEEYQKARLPIEYQTQIRRLGRERNRLDIAQRELGLMGSIPLQDHEIAHIWGIPLSSLAARKVKSLHHYLQALQARLEKVNGKPQQALATPVDLWKETFAVLAAEPLKHSVAVYDGLEGSEAALIDKLTNFATGVLTEDAESRFWQIVSRDYSPNAVEGQGKRQSLFALQRLSAVLSIWTSPMRPLKKS